MASFKEKESGWSQLTRGAPLAVLVAAALYTLYQLLPVWKLVALATLIAVILRTLLRWLYKLVKIRWVAVFLLVGLIVGFSVLLAAVIVPSIIFETQTLLLTLPNYLNALSARLEQLHNNFSLIPDFSKSLNQLRNFTTQILATFPILVSQVLGVTLDTVATLILAVYMAYNPNALISGILRLVPRKHHQRIQRVLKATEVRLRGWIFGTGIAMLFLGVGATLGLGVLGIPLSLSFGIIAGIFEIVPYFGSIAGTFLPALVAFTISPLKLLLVLGLFLILNQIDAHIVQPLVMGRQVNIHPVMVILTFLVMGKLFGFVGVLLAVPAAAVIVTLIDEFVPASDRFGAVDVSNNHEP